MRKIFTLLLTCMSFMLASLRSDAQCDQDFYSDLAGPCAASVCGYDPYCCDTEWDFFCSGEAASDPNCAYCWTGCYDNDLDGYTNCDGDCDDFNDTIHPGALDVCNNGIDEDCNASIDDGGCDQFGYSNLVSPCAISVCAGDAFCCDVQWDNLCASAATADNDCQNCWCGCYDNDLDGFTNCDGDCDDFDDTSYPGAIDLCTNGIDEDCNGIVDDGACDAPGYTNLGSPCGISVCGDDPFCCSTAWDNVCAAEAAADDDCQFCWCGCYDNDLDGYTNCDGDCDDFDTSIHPGAAEICSNDVDEDCDGWVDNSPGACDNLNYSDLSGPCGISVCLSDPFCCSTSWDILCAAEAVADAACAYCLCGCYDNDLDGFTNCNGDCDDFNPLVYPGNAETCNSTDDNCNGSVDEGLAFPDYYEDLDGDGYGTVYIGSFCSAPALSATLDGDCDDADTAINPGMIDSCSNEIDDDCNGNIDDAAGSCDIPNYADLGGPCAADVCSIDPYCCDTQWDFVCVAEAISMPACSYCICGCYDYDLDGFTNCDGDCNDSDASIYPGASEICNELDDDCDGTIDNGVVYNTFYEDADGDGYGNLSLWTDACFAPIGYVSDATDCDDGDGNIYPGASETCNDIDDDCDGSVDDSVPTSAYYADSDGDGYGNPSVWVLDCSTPLGYVSDDSDCDDTDSSIHPGATETCDGEDEDCDGSVDDNVAFNFYYADMDNDGYGDMNTTVFDCAQPFGYVTDDSDCDDTDDTIQPGATETCDNVDEDCDGAIDDGAPGFTYYLDNDGDGFGDMNISVTDCSAPIGYVTDDSDCDDSDDTIHPGATETCDDVDEDCDGTPDDGVQTFTFYQDSDDDGYGNMNVFVTDCSQPVGYVTDDSDCDDTDNSVHPGAAETCDNVDEDCDGAIDDGVQTFTFYADADNDGYGDMNTSTTDCSQPIGYVTDDTDCDDTDDSINPGATETCDDVDEDCDGAIDDGVITFTYYADMDSDGYGDGNNSTIACTQPLGYVGTNSDCDDLDASVHPDAPETCDDQDEDCDGLVDDGVPVSTYYADDDGDGFGDANSSIDDCSAPVGYVSDDTDCDDMDDSIYPGAAESCDNNDNDCNGLIDDGVVTFTFYADSDGDGFGDASVTTSDCIQPSGYVSDDTDCDDSDALIYPGGIEYCNSVDDDCDGTIDDNVIDLEYYSDLDGDGYGSTYLGFFCLPQPNASTTSGDCDDSDSSINPDASEICNDTDDDCDGNVDNGLTFTSYYEDMDDDGYGAAYIGDLCSQPANSSTNELDCDDSDSSVNPDGIETCNATDDDCDGSVDDGLTFSDYYEDLDNDGYGDFYFGFLCSAPANSATAGGDCDDTDDSVNPGMADICNSIDDDCNGQTDDGLTYLTYYSDADGDGYGSTLLGDYCLAPLSSSTSSGDCNDGDASVNPAATEVCNGTDDDCDSAIDNNLVFADYYEDLDDDGYGGALIGNFCEQPAGSVTGNSDCDDQDNSINPGASETCNDIDDDCDGDVDDGLFVNTYYVDQDNDGFGSTLLGDFCSPPANSAVTPGDCDDSSSAVNPLENESCNDIDDDCDGTIDDNVVYLDYFEDADNDGFGGALIGNLCSPPANGVTDNTDCDDNNGSVNPGVSEVCNDEDDNCNGLADEGLEIITYYSDDDGDGYGSTLLGDFCTPPPSSSIADGDCDDSNAAVHPALPEFCNNVDDNCDGNIDENVVYSDYFSDLDGDTYGSTFLGNFCVPPANSVTNSSDCDDTDAGVYPGAIEFCNLVDDDCDGLINEGLSTTAYYVDLDGDAVGGSLMGSFCFAPANSSTVAGDCDDNDSSIFPGATEVCNNIDDNCNGSIDEGAYTSYYADTDADGYGDYTQLVEACTAPSGYVDNQDDCDDTDATINPVAIEYCNSIDDDCDGTVDDDCINNVSEINGGLNVQLYPNPVKDQLSVQLLGVNGMADCIITDAVGKMVYSTRINSGNNVQTINCGILSQGSYTLTIISNNAQVHKQFMKL